MKKYFHGAPRFLRRCAACLLALGLLAGPAAPAAGAVGFTPTCEVSAEAAYLVNTDTNLIIYEKNSEQPLPAASLTKLVTASLLLERYGDDMDTPQLTAYSYLFDYVYGKNASHADIRQGEVLSPRTLLYAMMLPSANEAAYIVAHDLGSGQIDNFVNQMNAFASRLGCTGTRFYDPCGLDERNVTTARDAYLMIRYLMEFDIFREVCGSDEYMMPANTRHESPYRIDNTDRMVQENYGGNYYRSYAQGGKTGSLGEWQNFASWHNQNGETYICVVLHSPDSCDPYEYPTKRPALYETGQLMDWVFDSFSIQPALDTEQPIEEIKVDYSAEADTVMLYPADSMMTILPKDADGSVTQKTFHLPESIPAPVRQGDVVGTVTLSLSGEEIGTVELLAGRDIARSELLFVIARIGEFFGSLYFRVVVILSLIAVALYLGFFVWNSFKRRGAKKVRRRPY